MDNDDKQYVFFVRGGRMHHSWVLGFVNIEVGLVEDHQSVVDVASQVLLTRSDTRNLESEVLTRPGQWYLVSGYKVVHADDCYPTREEAANAYRDFLMQGAQ